jgi:hypothetical protein
MRFMSIVMFHADVQLFIMCSELLLIIILKSEKSCK